MIRLRAPHRLPIGRPGRETQETRWAAPNGLSLSPPYMRLSSPAFLRAGLFASGAVLAGCSDTAPLATAPSPGAPSLSVAAGRTAEILPLPQGRVIVRFRQGSAPGLAVSAEARQRAVEAFAQRHGARPDRALGLARAWLLETTPGRERELVASLTSDPGVEFAEVDEPIILQPCETGDCAATNDGFRGYKWDLHNDGTIFNSAGTVLGTTGRIDADIDWLEAFDALGSAFGGAAILGIIDSGIHPTHVDLAGKIVGAMNFATGYPATLIEDRDSHGTHVAGIAAARGNNGLGVAGVGFGANIKLLNAKSCERYVFPDGVTRTSCPTSSTANAIVWATDNGANALNLSLGGSPAATSGSALQQAALQYARSKGVLPFCATGNDGVTGSISFPARFPECVAVGATNWSDGRASYSNAGPQVALSAPGGDRESLPLGNSLILSTIPSAANASYGWKAGTSMATPQAVGLAGVLFASGVGNAEAVLARMQETADDLGAPGADAVFGAGRINVCRALDPAQLRVGMAGAISTRDASGAIVPVTLFGGPRFSVGQFDVADLTLGDGKGAEVAVSIRDGEYRSAIADVDGDGTMDLTLKFSRAALIANGDLEIGQRTMVLRGNVGCRRVQGTQTVRVTR